MTNLHLKVDQSGLELIAKWEGLRLKPYYCSANKLTVGVGHLIKESERSKYPEGVAISKDEAMRLLSEDVKVAESAIHRFITVELNQNQFNVLASFAFNVGTKWLSEGSVWLAVNQGRFSDVPAALLQFNKVRKQVVSSTGAVSFAKVEEPGLTNRRKDEGRIFLSKPGSTVLDGSSVKSVQSALIALGYDLGASGADGTSGHKTTSAIKQFQSDSGLTPDGKVGPKTISSLQAALDART